MSIPRILHQSWKTTDIPDQWQIWSDTAKRLHPDWDYRLWTDEDNEALIRSKVPEFLERYLAYTKPIMRADAVRYAYMYVHGGMYFDFDYEWVRPFDLQQHDVVLPISREENSDGGLRVGNCVFASIPGHPWWRYALDTLAAETEETHPDVEEITGPKFLTRCWKQYSAEHPIEATSVHLAPRPQFHPPSPKSDSAYQRILDRGEAYGIHHCTGVWRKRWWEVWK